MNASNKIRQAFLKSFKEAVAIYGGNTDGLKLVKAISIQGGIYTLVDDNDCAIVHNLNGNNMASFHRIFEAAKGIK